MKTTVNRWFAQAHPGSWTELVLAGVPFLIMGILPGLFSLIPAIKDLSPKYGIPILILMALILAGLGIIGLLVHLPRWSMIYAGILIALLPLSILVFSVSLEIIPTPPGWGSISTTAVTLAIFLIVQFILAGVLIWLSGKITLTSGFHHRVRSDPSLLALLFYGGTFFIMLINYDDIARGGYYQILSSAAMVLGAWGFLKAVNPRSKLLALTTGLTIAASLALIANLTLMEYTIPLVSIGLVSFPRPVIFVGMTWLVALAMILLPPLVVQYSPTAEA